MCYCPTPTLHLNLALTGDGAFLFSPKKTHTVWFISVLNYGDTENVLINHLLLVIPMSYPCHYTNLCPHKPHKHAHTHTHTHTTVQKFGDRFIDWLFFVYILIFVCRKNSLNWSECFELFYLISIKEFISFYKNIKQQNYFQLHVNNGNVSWASNQHIRIISIGSRDTENCNDCWKLSFCITGMNYILKYIQIENSYLLLLLVLIYPDK